MEPMSQQTDQHSQLAEIVNARRRVATPQIFELCVTFDLIGADWEFVNALHSAYEFEHNWPDGMLCHITSESAEGIHSQGIWTDADVEAAYFRDVAVNVITQAMADLGPAAGKYGAVDFEPVARSIDQLIIGSLLSEFQDIGPDHDAQAVHRLGTDPVVVQTRFNDAKPKKLADASRLVGLRTAAPEGLLMLLDETGEDGVPNQSQIWRSAEEAHEFWEQSFASALVDVGAVASETGMPQSRIHPIRRISVGSVPLAAVWRN